MGINYMHPYEYPAYSDFLEHLKPSVIDDCKNAFAIQVSSKTKTGNAMTILRNRIANQIMCSVTKILNSWAPARRVVMDDKDWANRIVISPIEIHLGYKEFLESVLMQSDMGPVKYKTPTTDDINLEDWVVDLLAVLTEFAKNGWRVHVERMNVNARILEDVKANREECGLDGDMVDPWMIHIYIYTQDTLDRYHEMKKEIPEDDFSNLEVYTLFEKRLVNTVVIDPEMFSVHWRDLADRLINPEEGDPIVVDMPTDNEGCNPSEPGNDTNEPAPINGNQIESENK